MVGTLGGTPFVGRERELTLLRSLLDYACAGQGRIALLAGEPGIGKTRLMEELAAEAQAGGATVLWGRCWEGEGAPAFWPWIQIVRALVRDRTPDALRAEAGVGAAEIAEIVPEVRAVLPDLPFPPRLEPDAARFRLFESVTAFLTAAAARRPLLLILDDLHWADAPSLALLRFLAVGIDERRLLIAGAYRELEAAEHEPLVATLAALRRERTHERLTLRGLPPAEVAALLQGASLNGVAEALAARLHQETEGNPFFVGELLRHLRESGSLDKRDHIAADPAASLGVPEGVREVIGRRLTRLTAPCVELLTLAAVVGREFALEALERARDAAPDVDAGGDALDLLAEAERARLVEPVAGTPGRYRFVHALIRETLYDGLTTAARVRLHRRAGEALEALYRLNPGPHLAELAHHFVEAAPGGDLDKAVEYARRAAEHATAAHAHEEAARHLEAALRLIDERAPVDGRERLELLIALAEAYHWPGDIARSHDCFTRAVAAARRLGEPELLAWAAVGFSRRAGLSAVADEGQVELLEEARQALGSADSASAVLVRVWLTFMLTFSLRHDQAQEISLEAVAIARRLGDPRLLAKALFARRVANQGFDTPAEQVALTSEALGLDGDATDDELMLACRGWHIAALRDLGETARADAEIDRLEALGATTHNLYARVTAELARADQALRAGRFDEALRRAAETEPITRQAAQFVTRRLLPVGEFCARRHQGMTDTTAAALRERVIVASPPERTALPRCIVAALDLDRGRSDDARRIFDELAIDDFAHLPKAWSGGWVPCLSLLAELCAALDDAPRAATLYDLLRPHAALCATWNTLAWFGPVARYLGLLAATLHRWDDAAAHFEAAITACDRMGDRPHGAHARHEYARMLLTRAAPDDHERAYALLAEALATAEELGMAPLVGRIRVLTPGVPAPTPGPSSSSEPPAPLRSSSPNAGGGEPSVAPAPLGTPSPSIGGRGRGMGAREGMGAGEVSEAALSPRELDVLRLLAQGRSNREIAETLVISLNTVLRHVTNILIKTGAANRTEAAAYAHRHGLAT